MVLVYINVYTMWSVCIWWQQRSTGSTPSPLRRYYSHWAGRPATKRERDEFMVRNALSALSDALIVVRKLNSYYLHFCAGHHATRHIRWSFDRALVRGCFFFVYLRIEYDEVLFGVSLFIGNNQLGYWYVNWWSLEEGEEVGFFFFMIMVVMSHAERTVAKFNLLVIHNFCFKENFYNCSILYSIKIRNNYLIILMGLSLPKPNGIILASKPKDDSTTNLYIVIGSLL